MVLPPFPELACHLQDDAENRFSKSPAESEDETPKGDMQVPSERRTGPEDGGSVDLKTKRAEKVALYPGFLL